MNCFGMLASWPLPRPLEHALAGVTRTRPQLLFDADELVVLGVPVRARERAGLDLAGIGGDGDVGDGRILGLAGAMRDDGAVAGLVRHLDRFEGFREAAN